MDSKYTNAQLNQPPLSRRPEKSRQLLRRDRMAQRFIRWPARLPWSWLHVLGAVYGFWMYALRGRHKHITETNINFCFPDETEFQRQALVLKSLQFTAQIGLEMLWVWLRPPAATLSRVHGVVGEELFLQALNESQGGVVVLAPHLGNWEVLNLWMTSKCPITTLYRPIKLPSINAMVHAARSRLNSSLVPTTRQGVAMLLKTLKARGVVGILPDQEPDSTAGVYAPFYGHPALTATLSVKLIQQTKSLAICAYAKKLSSGGYQIEFQWPDKRLYSDDLAEACAALNASVQACIAACPEQYQWSYKRFANPQVTPSIYDQ